MAEFRIPWGLALGPVGGPIAYTNSIRGIQLLQANTAPDVTNVGLCFTNNTSTTVINWLESQQQGKINGPADGKIVTIFFQDNSTTVANSNRIFLSSTNGNFNSGGILQLIHINSGWYEMFRSRNQRNEVTSSSVAGSGISVDVTDVKLLIMNPTAGGALVSFSGGYIGQHLDMIKAAAAAGTALTVSGAGTGNIFIAGTNVFVMNDSGMYGFAFDGVRWLMSRPVA